MWKLQCVLQKNSGFGIGCPVSWNWISHTRCFPRSRFSTIKLCSANLSGCGTHLFGLQAPAWRQTQQLYIGNSRNSDHNVYCFSNYTRHERFFMAQLFFQCFPSETSHFQFRYLQLNKVQVDKPEYSQKSRIRKAIIGISGIATGPNGSAILLTLRLGF